MNERYVKNKMELAKIKKALQEGRSTDGLQVLGSGPLNRDGVPQLPPEQKAVDRWPVLDLGIHPEISREQWSLDLKGACDKPKTLSFQDLLALPQVEDVSDFHCVTGWSKLSIQWRGVRFSDLARAAQIRPEAQHALMHAYDNYTTNVSLEEAMKNDVLLVYQADGEPLPIEHGGPVRMITPQLWAWKGAKWIKAIEFLVEDQKGFWEVRGYSNTAIPWLNDRFS